jgi:two-component system, LytTR family, sensor kinase
LEIKPIKYRDVIVGLSVSWLSWTLLQTLAIHFSLGLELGHAFSDTLLTNVVLGIATYAMINVMRFYQPSRLLRLIYSTGLALISTMVIHWLAPLLIRVDPAYETFLHQSFLIRALFSWLVIGLVTSSAWLWFSLRDQQEVESRKAANEKMSREAELSKLRQQLQPHFLFNSLNSISALVGSRPDEARKMIQQLSDFLRGTLKKDDSQLVTLAEEVEHLQLYLDIEKVRFGHRLRTHMDNDDAAMTMRMPSLLLQPIVENAIKFGLYDTTGEIVIRIFSKLQDNYLSITVENPFDPTTAKPKQGTGFGLNSVQRRLHLLYARQDLLTTNQNDLTFTTNIKIPQIL